MRFPAKIMIVGAFAAGLLGPAHAQRGGGERSGPAQPPLWLPDEDYLRWLPPQWFPTSWEVAATGSGKTVSLKTAFPIYHSAGIGSADLEPVWAGLGLPADFIGRDVKGKAVIVYGIPTPGGRSDSALTNGSIQRAEDAGAAALFIILGFPGNVASQPTGGAVDPARMPVMMLGSEDGAAVR